MIEDKLQALVGTEMRYRWAFYRILALCLNPCSIRELNADTQLNVMLANAVHSAEILLEWLATAGAVEPVISAEEGPEASEERESRTATTQPETLWRVTASGRAFLDRDSPESRLTVLFSHQAEFIEAYRSVIRFCKKPRTALEVEQQFGNLDCLKSKRIYPAFLLQSLEQAGGLEWQGTGWRATAAGEALTA